MPDATVACGAMSQVINTDFLVFPIVIQDEEGLLKGRWKNRRGGAYPC